MKSLHDLIREELTKRMEEICNDGFTRKALDCILDEGDDVIEDALRDALSEYLNDAIADMLEDVAHDVIEGVI